MLGSWLLSCQEINSERCPIVIFRFFRKCLCLSALQSKTLALLSLRRKCFDGGLRLMHEAAPAYLLEFQQQGEVVVSAWMPLMNASTVARGSQQGNAWVQIRCKASQFLCQPCPGLSRPFARERGLGADASLFLTLLEGSDGSPAATNAADPALTPLRLDWS